jgi:hypothetical protein
VKFGVRKILGLRSGDPKKRQGRVTPPHRTFLLVALAGPEACPNRYYMQPSPDFLLQQPPATPDLRPLRAVKSPPA